MLMDSEAKLTTGYRLEIDGLRAIAVLSVLLYHFGFSAFGGGFVGVDVFFVISGYLITSNIITKIEGGGFSLMGFYERRFRRLLPAYFVVVISSLAVGIYFLTPKDYEELAKSAAASAVFSSNIFFFSESGYFDGPAELKPLLHTWSLALEEQFYFFLPFLLMLAYKLGGRLILWLAITAALSLLLSALLTNSYPSAAFYLLPTRAWELLAGGILALNVVSAPQNRVLRESFTAGGLFLILISVFTFSSETAFPGYAAIAPVAGTFLLILGCSGGRSLVRSLLEHPLMVGVGLISYSLYLWHWPVIVYSRLYSITEISLPHVCVAFVFTFVISWFTWKYIENPFRKPRNKGGHATSFIKHAAVASLVVVMLGAVVIVYEGFPGRSAGAVKFSESVDDDEWMHWQSCENVVARLEGRRGLCKLGISGKASSFILWGDSHAMTMASGLDMVAAKNGLSGEIATHSGCAPLVGVGRLNRDACIKFNRRILHYIEENESITRVILSARWVLSMTGERYKNESGKPVTLTSLEDHENGTMDDDAVFMAGLDKLLSKLSGMGKKVVILGQVPEVGYNVPAAHLAASFSGRDINQIIAPARVEFEQRNRALKDFFVTLDRRYEVEIVSIGDFLCGASSCDVTKAGHVLYRDDDHLSTFGSEYIGPVLESALND